MITVGQYDVTPCASSFLDTVARPLARDSGFEEKSTPKAPRKE